MREKLIMTAGKLLIILIFFMEVRAGFIILFSGASGITNYYIDLAGQIVMYIGIYLFCLHQFKIDRHIRSEIFGSSRFVGIASGAGLGLTLLCFTFGESALISLSISQMDRALAYRLGSFHETAFPAHPFFSTHVISFIIASVLMPAIVEEFLFRGLLRLLQNSDFVGDFIAR